MESVMWLFDYPDWLPMLILVIFIWTIGMMIALKFGVTVAMAIVAALFLVCTFIDSPYWWFASISGSVAFIVLIINMMRFNKEQDKADETERE